MSSIVSQYSSPVAVRSHLLRNPPDTVPPTEELQQLHTELLLLKQKTLERAKKAGDDLRTIEESFRRLKEKEKGKSKAIDKVKKERGSVTPLPNGDEARHSAQPQATHHKPRPPPFPVTNVPPPPSSVASVESRKSMTEEVKKKKKKRKRDDSSDVEAEPVKARKTSPLPPHTHPHPPPPPPKASKFPGSLHSFPKPAGQDFSVPSSSTLLPSRPPIPPPPIPGPSKPTDVKDDFSKSKAPNQILVNTFYTSIEPYLRPIKEEDIGFLEFTADEVEPLILPKLGRHYSEVWEEEDIALYGGPLPGTAAANRGNILPGSSSMAPLPKWEPSTLTDHDTLAEEKGHGPLTERLVSALIPMHNTEWKGVKAAEESMEGRPGTNGAAAAAARDKLNVADLEERIKNVMRFHGLISEIPDFSEAVDDPIATALRHAQRDLRTVMATNKARKERLANIARDRLAYQEYVDLRDSIDKNITTLYAKLQKKDGPKAAKKKKKGEMMNGSNGAVNGVSVPPPCPAALGLAPDDDNRLNVPDQLKQLVQTRRHWVDVVGGVFREKQKAEPGRIWGLPPHSVFAGIDEEVRQLLERTSMPMPGAQSSASSSTNLAARTNLGSKGKARASQSDAMELG